LAQAEVTQLIPSASGFSNSTVLISNTRSREILFIPTLTSDDRECHFAD